MKTKCLLLFACLGLAVASAKSYTVSLFQTVKLGSMELQAGEYKVEVVDQKAIFRNGRLHGEAQVKVENGDKKWDRTTVRLTSESMPHIQEIRIGGTKTKLVFNE